MLYDILAEGLEAVENDVYAKTRAGRSATLRARVVVVQGTISPCAVVSLGVLGSPVGNEVRVTADDFVDGEFRLSDIEDELCSIAHGLGKYFGLDVVIVPQRGVNTQAWIFTAETVENRHERPVGPPAAHDEYMAAEQLTEETLSLLDRCVGVAFQLECSLRERGWDDAEATTIAAELRTTLFMNVAPTILCLESQWTHRSVEENS